MKKEIFKRNNPQLEAIKEWCDKKQIAENNEKIGNIITLHDYFREFWIDFNLSDSVGLKTQNEIIFQNKLYNELYLKYRNFFAEISILKEKIEKDIKNGFIRNKNYCSELSDLLSKYDFIDSVQEKLRARNVNGV